jgi:hypothetical protein
VTKLIVIELTYHPLKVLAGHLLRPAVAARSELRRPPGTRYEPFGERDGALDPSVVATNSRDRLAQLGRVYTLERNNSDTD